MGARTSCRVIPRPNRGAARKTPGPSRREGPGAQEVGEDVAGSRTRARSSGSIALAVAEQRADQGGDGPFGLGPLSACCARHLEIGSLSPR
jgi:hypothetical protein